MTNTVVRARIDEHLKEEAAAVLATIGLSVSDAIRSNAIIGAKNLVCSARRSRCF